MAQEESEEDAQIDLVIERADHINNICEMKFCEYAGRIQSVITMEDLFK